jgi:hypothetical protein
MAIGTLFTFLSVSCQAQQPPAKKTVETRQEHSPAEKNDTMLSGRNMASTTRPSNDSAATGTRAARPTVRLIVYYFHGNMRCPTCYNLEQYAKEAVEASFADAIKNGALEWRTVNVETDGNEHFNDDYKLYTKSVIVSTWNDGREVSWKNLDKIWQLVHDERTYKEYITREVAACLKGKCL